MTDYRIFHESRGCLIALDPYAGLVHMLDLFWQACVKSTVEDRNISQSLFFTLCFYLPSKRVEELRRTR